MMTLRKIFADEVSSSAFSVIDDELRIVGKFCQITQLDNGLFDIWLIGPELKPLSNKKINSIAQTLPQEALFKHLTGEAYAQVAGKDFILQNLPSLGIKKKRRLSDEAKVELSERLRNAV